VVEGVNGGADVLASALATGNGTGTPPAQVVVDLPSGYTAAPTAPGTTVGLALLASTSSSGQGNTSATIVSAELTADDPARYASDAAAQACAPGTPVAVWKLTTTIVGLSYTLPVFVEHPASNPEGLELRFCPPPLTGSDGKPLATPPVPLSGALFLLFPLQQPTAPGSYTSSAFFTSAGPSGAPDPTTTAETRFLRTVPHILTAKGRYDKKTRDAVVTGRVTELGQPQSGAVVEYAAVSASSSGSIVVGAAVKRVRASATGTFTIRTRISKTTTFLLDVANTVGPCQAPSTAPRGCLSETVEGTGEKDVRVVVPRR